MYPLAVICTQIRKQVVCRDKDLDGNRFRGAPGLSPKTEPSWAILALAATESPKGIDREGKELKLS